MNKASHPERTEAADADAAVGRALGREEGSAKASAERSIKPADSRISMLQREIDGEDARIPGVEIELHLPKTGISWRITAPTL